MKNWFKLITFLTHILCTLLESSLFTAGHVFNSHRFRGIVNVVEQFFGGRKWFKQFFRGTEYENGFEKANFLLHTKGFFV